MKSNFAPKGGDVNSLSHDERFKLESVIIPAAERWMSEYPEGSTLWGHGRQTLAYWGRLVERSGAAA